MEIMDNAHCPSRAPVSHERTHTHTCTRAHTHTKINTDEMLLVLFYTYSTQLDNTVILTLIKGWKKMIDTINYNAF